MVADRQVQARRLEKGVLSVNTRSRCSRHCGYKTLNRLGRIAGVDVAEKAHDEACCMLHITEKLVGPKLRLCKVADPVIGLVMILKGSRCNARFLFLQELHLQYHPQENTQSPLSCRPKPFALRPQLLLHPPIRKKRPFLPSHPRRKFRSHLQTPMHLDTSDNFTTLPSLPLAATRRASSTEPDIPITYGTMIYIALI